MFDVELNSIGQKSLSCPQSLFSGLVGFFFLVSFCGFFVGGFFFPPSPALPGCIAGEGDAQDGERLVALNLKREGFIYRVYPSLSLVLFAFIPRQRISLKPGR